MNDERIITLNCGVGRDSTTMLCLLFAGQLHVDGLGTLGVEDIDAAVFSDTGCEWPHTYELEPQLARLCAKHGLPFITLAKPGCLQDAKYQHAGEEDWTDKIGAGAYHYRLSVLEDFQSRQTVASLGKGDCTDNHKIQPIRRFLNDLSQHRFGLNNRRYANQVRKGNRQPHVALIGYAADEQRRLNNGEGRTPAYASEAFPLIDMDISKAREAQVLRMWGLDHVMKSGCFICPYQPAGWWWALSVAEPELWGRAVTYETIAMERNPRMAATGFKRKGKPGTIVEMVRSWREKNPHATVADVLAKTYSQCPERARAEMKGV